MGSEPADRLDVDVPGPLGKAGKPHVVDHTLTQRGHGRSPFGFKRQDLCPGTDQIPQHAVLNDYAFYGEAVSPTAHDLSDVFNPSNAVPSSEALTNQTDRGQMNGFDFYRDLLGATRPGMTFDDLYRVSSPQ